MTQKLHREAKTLDYRVQIQNKDVHSGNTKTVREQYVNDCSNNDDEETIITAARVDNSSKYSGNLFAVGSRAASSSVTRKPPATKHKQIEELHTRTYTRT